MTLEEDYKLAKRIDELLCTEFDKNSSTNQHCALIDYLLRNNIKVTELDITEHYCLTMAEKKALREFGRFDELKRIYGEHE